MLQPVQQTSPDLLTPLRQFEEAQPVLAQGERTGMSGQLSQQRRTYEAMLSSISDFAYLFDLDGRFRFANKPLLDLWGLTLEQAAGRNFFDLKYHDDLAARLQREIQQVIETRTRVVGETEYTSPAGVVGYYEYIFSPVIAADGSVEAVAGSTRDISARKNAENTVRASESRFRQMADAMPQMVWVTRADGYHEYYNRQWYQFTGVPEGSTDGEGWNGMFHPDDQQRAWGLWRHSLATGEPYEVEYRLRHHSGQYRWTLGRALPLRNAHGDFERWFGTCTDIDDQKRAEEERERLLESEQAALIEADAASRAKDKFLAVLSHELRTPLSPVVMAIAAMEIDEDLPFKFRDDIAMIRRNIDLEARLIDDLLDLSRITSGKLRLQMEPVRVHGLLRHVLRSSVSDLLEKQLTVRTQLDAAGDAASADPARLQQVFWNLLRNAAKFTPEGGSIVVRTWNAKADGHLFIEVRDTGVGIRADALPHIFDAFDQGDMRTTRQFGGLGLGLAIAKAIVDMHGGIIRADSAGQDQGATFTVRLSSIEATADTPSAVLPGHRARAPGKRPRVLLVEDHPDTARTLAKLLNNAGYDVRTAGSVAAALQLAAAEPFDVVVSDIGLPDATGYELMEQIRDRYGIKGIALSGYGMEDDMRRSKGAGFVDHVVKPVNVAQLDATLQRVMNDTPR